MRTFNRITARIDPNFAELTQIDVFVYFINQTDVINAITIG